MAKFRKRPVVIEAFQWTADEHQLEDPVWICDALRAGDASIVRVGPDVRMEISTLEGVMTAQPGDWVLRGTAGEIYPCKPDIFAAIYEPVEGDSETSQPGVLAAKPESSDSQGGPG